MTDLATLPEAEQRALYEELAYKFAKGSSGKIAVSAKPDAMMFDIIVEVIAQNPGKPISAFFPNWVKSYGHAHYADRSATILATIDHGLSRILRRAEKRKVIACGLDSLVDSMIERNIPVIPGTVLDQADFLFIAINKSFPGYAKAGMLHRIANLA